MTWFVGDPGDAQSLELRLVQGGVTRFLEVRRGGGPWAEFVNWYLGEHPDASWGAAHRVAFQLLADRFEI